MRELENTIERATLLASSGGAIEYANLPTSITAHHALKHTGITATKIEGSTTESMRDEIPSKDTPDPRLLATKNIASGTNLLNTSEYRLIKEAIEKCQGNLSLASRDLGITRAKVAYRAKKFGLEYLCRSRS